MIALEHIHSLTDFQRHPKAHLKRLKNTGQAGVLTVNGKAELIVQSAAAYVETLDAIRGIQRGLDAMLAGTGQPFREALDGTEAEARPRRGKK